MKFAKPWELLVKSLPFYFALFVLYAGCARTDTSGNTMETENSIAVRVTSYNGQPAARVQATVRPLWYLADTAGSDLTNDQIRNLTTDEGGRLLIEDLPPGRYVLHLYTENTASLLEFNIPTDIEYNNNTLELKPKGVIEGLVSLPDSASYAWIQVHGLNIAVRTDSLGRFQINNLPAGSLQVIAWTPQSPSAIGSQLVVVNASETIDLGSLPPPTLAEEDPSTWRYSLELPVDSLVSEWMKPIQSPTVLTLRLNANNFTFAQALSDGRDLRIEDAAGRPVLFDRVRWDSSKQLAVIHLRLGNLADTSRSFTIRWGRMGAVDPGRTAVWNGLSDSLRLALNSVFVDDFERRSSRTALPPPIPSSWWFTRRSDSASVNPEPGSDFLPALQPAGAGRSGQALRIGYQATGLQWILVGTTLGTGPHSLAVLDSIVFWVRGTGNYSVSLENNSSEPWGKAWVHGDLDTLWTRVCVRPALDFMPGDSSGGNIGWESVMDSITNLSFFGTNGQELWLDDIRLHGINIDDLL